MQSKNIHPIILHDLEKIAESLSDGLEQLEGSTVLIAGGNGFIGKYFVNSLLYLNEHILKKPCRIIVLDRSISADEPYLISNENIEIIEFDISKEISIEHKIDFIIHSASIASPVVYRKYPLETILVNVYGTKNLLDLAKKHNVKSFLYLSSSEIYGDPTPNQIPTKEDYRGNVSSTGPRACYDESKRVGETLCMTYLRQFSTPVKIVRPFNVYGPGLKPNDGRVISDFVSNSLTKGEVVLYSDGSPTRSFCYISDAIVGFLKVLLSKHNGESFNIGNDEEVSMLELAKIVQNEVPDLKIRFEIHPDKDYRIDNPQRRCPDLAKIKKSVGYTPTVKLKEGMGMMTQWYKYILNKN